MVRNVLRLVLVVNSVSKALNRVEKIPICVVVNSNPEGFTVHVNSDRTRPGYPSEVSRVVPPSGVPLYNP